MDGTELIEGARFAAAAFGVVMGLLAMGLALRAILRKPTGQYHAEFNTFAMATGAILWALPGLASKETRSEVETIGTIGLGLFLASCGAAIALHRLKTPHKPSTRE